MRCPECGSPVEDGVLTLVSRMYCWIDGWAFFSRLADLLKLLIIVLLPVVAMLYFLIPFHRRKWCPQCRKTC